MKTMHKTPKPTLLFYCQHSIGMGHLVRSFRLVKVLARQYHIVFINGGRIPEGIEQPENIQLENIPPVGMTADSHVLMSQDSRYSVEQAKQMRQQSIMRLWQQFKPEVIVIELFPFGRKKFADELLPLLEAAQQDTPQTKIFCSLRDILVRTRHDQQRFENKASTRLNRYFDAVLLHCDPAFATLAESFKPDIPLQIPVYHTGFIAPIMPTSALKTAREARIIVSAGGGSVGNALFQTALAAQAMIWQQTKLKMTIVAGPFLPETEWQALKQQAANKKHVTLVRTVAGLLPLLRQCEISVSQCGYNTTMELLQSGIKALVVPFHCFGENEQMNRAKRLQKAGAIQLLEPSVLSPQTLTQAMIELQQGLTTPHALAMQGAEKTLNIITKLSNKSHYKPPLAQKVVI